MADTGQRLALRLLNGLAGRGLLVVVLLSMAVRAVAGGVTLAWDPVTSPLLVGYMVYYGPAAGNYTASIDVGNTTSYTVSGLIEGTTYHFATTAYDATHTQSGFSNDAAATVPYGAPVAQFSASTTSGTAPLALNFLNTSTGTVTTYAWTFGDGTTATTPSPAHVYSLAGVYTVSLTVTGPGGSNTKTNNSYITVSAAAQPTTTTVSSALNPSLVGTSVTFTATVTGTAPTGSVAFTDGGGTITGCSAVALPAGTANSKTATCSTASLTVGTHSIVATYGGNSGNNASASSTLTQTVNKATSTAALASSVNPSVVGTSVTFMATVTGTAPTGSVAFTDGGSTISGCGAVTLPAGTASSKTATCSTSSLTSGAHNIVATYGGDSGNNASTSSTLTQTVNKATSTATLASSANPSLVGTGVTFMATVTGTAPTGSIAFTDGGATITGCGALALPAGTASSKTATCGTASLSMGTHSIVATYAGDAGNNGSTSTTLSQVVSNKTASNTTLSSSGSPSLVGTSVTFTATVTGTAPTGSVAFTDGGSAIAGCGAVALPTGSTNTKSATCSTSSLSLGTHSIVATYGGDVGNNGSTSATWSQTVSASPTATATTLTSSANPSLLGASVTLTATVAGAAPTGSVNFKDGGTAISGCAASPVSGTGNSGTATCTTSSLALGTHSLVASYSGDAGNTGSTSATWLQTVSSAPTATATTLTSSANPSLLGASVTFTATIAPLSGSGTPTGVVTFKNGTTTIGSGALNAGGIATLSTSALTAGTHSITAAYGGDATLQPSTSSAISQVISAATTCSGNTATNGSLVEHYYTAILRRSSDAGGKAFWMSEADRLCALGADPKETFVVMANVFFNTPEYLALNRDDNGFVTDLYNTFFSRQPDAGGLSYWLSQLAAGMPRNNVMNSFLFSAEFTTTMNAAFPGQTARAETYLVLNLYGGLFRRLADTGGYTNWTGQFRAAQCNASPAAAVQATIDSVTSQLVVSAEYAARATTNSQYVVDLYYALLQRGADAAGYNYGVGQLNGGSLSREQLRQQFLTSPEMTAQSAAIAAQGCST